MLFCHPKNSCLCKPLVCVPSRSYRYIYAYRYIFYSVVVIFLPTSPLSEGSDLENMLVLRREEKNSFVLKAAVLSIEELDWILLLRGFPTRCQPSDLGCFSQLVVKTHLHFHLLSWTCKAASVLSQDYLQQASTLLPGTSTYQHPQVFFCLQILLYRHAGPRGKRNCFL